MAIGSFITSLVGSCVPFVFSWTSLAHFLSLGFLGPFLNFAFPWTFTEFFGLPRPNYIISHPWGSWACHQPLTFFAFITLGLSWLILTFLHHILPMVCFFLSFWAPLSPFTPTRPICLSYGPVIHYSYRLGLMSRPNYIISHPGAHGLAINPLLSLLSLLWACCGPFSLFYIIYYPWFAFLSLSGLL